MYLAIVSRYDLLSVFLRPGEGIAGGGVTWDIDVVNKVR
jgi:hypothetical protein